MTKSLKCVFWREICLEDPDSLSEPYQSTYLGVFREKRHLNECHKFRKMAFAKKID